MNARQRIVSSISGSLIIVTLLIWWQSIPISDARSVPEGAVQVTFFDVGQGDAIYIETPDGVQALIDGGPDSGVLQQIAAELGFFDTTLDLIIGTHPDLDHVGGLVDVLARYSVTAIVTTEATGTSPAAEAYAKAVAAEGATIQFARAGDVIALGATTTLTILSPTYNPQRLPSNAGSIVALLEHGSSSVLLTGDASSGIETYLVEQYGSALQAGVLKLGHHGSNTSSASAFLAVVDPMYAVVSAGVNNRYDHPHQDVLERLATHTTAQVYSTQTGSQTFYLTETDVLAP